MCNKIHETGARPIRKTGKGWKIFCEDGNPCFSSCDFLYHKSSDGSIVWNTTMEHEFTLNPNAEQGFCFFLREKEAIRCLKAIKRCDDGSCDPMYDDHHIRRIEYFDGMVRQKENEICDGTFEIALCKGWRFADNIKIQ